MLDFDIATESLNDLHSLDDAELLLLKGHVIVERMLYGVVAARLGCDDDELPKLSYSGLVKLAFAPHVDNREPRSMFRDADAAVERKRLGWVNELRNVVAHEFRPMESQRFKEIIERFGVPWPDDSLSRCLVVDWIVERAYWFVYYQYAMYDLTGDKRAEAEDSADRMFDGLDAVAVDMRAGRWESLIRVLRESGPRPVSG